MDVQVEGVKLRRGLVKKFVPIFEESAVDDDLLNEGPVIFAIIFRPKAILM